MNEYKDLYVNKGFTIFELCEKYNLNTDKVCDLILLIEDNDIELHRKSLFNRIMNFYNIEKMSPSTISKNTGVSLSLVKSIINQNN